jgi:hypothetical protein
MSGSGHNHRILKALNVLKNVCDCKIPPLNILRIVNHQEEAAQSLLRKQSLEPNGVSRIELTGDNHVHVFTLFGRQTIG